mmetsp:Transcript_59158/g.103222  ORF Transcript_59158/g.103222 Transcript_59158/m.103222 type:complete len:89 (-) Transcript_59158:726-992(-)
MLLCSFRAFTAAFSLAGRNWRAFKSRSPNWKLPDRRNCKMGQRHSPARQGRSPKIRLCRQLRKKIEEQRITTTIITITSTTRTTFTMT